MWEILIKGTLCDFYIQIPLELVNIPKLFKTSDAACNKRYKQ